MLHLTLHPSLFGPLFNNLINSSMVPIERSSQHPMEWVVGRAAMVERDRWKQVERDAQRGSVLSSQVISCVVTWSG